MAEELGLRLVRAGLVTRGELAVVRASAPLHEGALVRALVQRGLSEDALAGFFLAAGYGPLMNASDLASASPEALKRVPAAMVHELLAVPVRTGTSGLVVAMAAPTDRHALTEIARRVGADVLPTVARVSELDAAIERAYGASAAAHPITAPESEPPPALELVRKRPVGYQSSTRGAERVDARATVGPRLKMEDDDAFVPLVRHRRIAPAPREAPRKVMITDSFERPAERAGQTREEPPAPKAPPQKKSIIPIEHQRWDLDAPIEAPVPKTETNKADASVMRMIDASAPKRPARPSPIGGTLAALRGSNQRDEVVELACHGALTVCRAAVLLALRKGVLKGLDGAGPGISKDAVANIWIPTSGP